MKRRTVVAMIGGAALAWPWKARAQQYDRMRRVGVLLGNAEGDPEGAANIAAFTQALATDGWIEHRNVNIEYRWTAGDGQRSAAYVSELTGLAPDVIVANGASMSALKQATSTIPVVFVLFMDAVAQTYVSSFAHPGGNVTGFTSYELSLVGKRLELLKEISPGLTKVVYVRGASPSSRVLFLRLAADASALGIVITDVSAMDVADVEHAVTSFANAADAGLIFAFDAFNTAHRDELVEIAARARLPAIYPYPIFAKNGGLICYGVDEKMQFGQAAKYVDRILKGENPGDLPVQAPTKFELVINLKTAKALGLTIPPTLLARADEVIE